MHRSILLDRRAPHTILENSYNTISYISFEITCLLIRRREIRRLLHHHDIVRINYQILIEFYLDFYHFRGQY